MDSKQDNNTEELKEIPKWTRKYAQNRMLTTFVLIVLVCLIAMVIGGLLGFVPVAFRKGNMVLAGVGIALLAAILIMLVIFVLKFGGKNKGLIDQRIDQWIYGKEGTASVTQQKLTKKKMLREIVVGLVFSICIIGSMYLAVEGFIAYKYLQPFSAIFIVPLLVVGYFTQRPKLGPILLICPVLYTVHAILILAGVPIFFTGRFSGLSNQFLPLFAYTFLAYMIGHIYSRYALKKLKGIAGIDGDGANGV